MRQRIQVALIEKCYGESEELEELAKRQKHIASKASNNNRKTRCTANNWATTNSVIPMPTNPSRLSSTFVLLVSIYHYSASVCLCQKLGSFS
jgi:hypothetical protein